MTTFAWQKLRIRLLGQILEHKEGTVSMTSRLTGRIFRLQPADTHDVVAERHVKVPMPDGLGMLADRTDADSHHLGPGSVA